MLYSVDIEIALSNWRSLHGQSAFNDFRAVKSDTPELLGFELSGLRVHRQNIFKFGLFRSIERALRSLDRSARAARVVDRPGQPQRLSPRLPGFYLRGCGDRACSVARPADFFDRVV
jgi:hypothetical protein